jgi:uncharacterized paraquat-inducible protein A
MNKEDVIRIAREAGMTKIDQDGLIEHFQRFAALCAAKEREECAELCKYLHYNYDVEGAMRCMDAIHDRRYNDDAY